MSRIIDGTLQEGEKTDFDGIVCDRIHQKNTISSIPFQPHSVDQILPRDLCEILKHEHNTIVEAMPTSKGKPLNWKVAMKNYIEDGIPSLLRHIKRNAYPEKFHRIVHVEIDVLGVGPISGNFNVFFDPYTSDNYIGGKCATRFGLKSKPGAAHLIKGVRWHAEEDKKLKDPRLHFNHFKYEEGNFLYAESLGELDLVIGWNTIQSLRLLWPTSDLAAAGEGFRQLPRTIDPNVARLNQPAVTQAREQELERMRQHTERKAQKAAAATVSARRN